MRFDYLLEKIKGADLDAYPFTHLEINDFFTEDDFQEIVAANEISFDAPTTDEELFAKLFDRGYRIITFPGCITDRDVYIKWHKTKQKGQTLTNTACEGFGVTVRLIEPKSKVLQELRTFMESQAFQQVLAAKFGVDLAVTTYDSGIQKYLDGYEISPHPDIRRKALTYMVNVNPGTTSEREEHHTHYLKFREAYKYVQAYWEGNPGKDRCWVPWDWCESLKVQTRNNSIVIFAPGDDTVHAVKANYNHFAYQRTQLYGNLWYKEVPFYEMPAWEDFVIKQADRDKHKKSPKGLITAMLPTGVKTYLKEQLGKRKQDDKQHHTRKI